ncbi:MAG: hypothetical protein WC770_00540 [Phycisphaerae bacterium]|jgi:DNA-directed RNA polymerase subunit M/transcription elongation factor TFIIS
MDEKIIKIASFNDYTNAEIAKISLESAGIDCFLSGENFVATYWLLASADGGIKLYIKHSDKQQAEEILKASAADAGNAQFTDEEEYDLKCPKCGGTEINYERFSRWSAFLSILILRFPITYSIKTYSCQSCGHKWKEPTPATD